MKHRAPNPNEIIFVSRCNVNNVEVFPSEANSDEIFCVCIVVFGSYSRGEKAEGLAMELNRQDCSGQVSSIHCES